MNINMLQEYTNDLVVWQSECIDTFVLKKANDLHNSQNSTM